MLTCSLLRRIDVGRQNSIEHGEILPFALDGKWREKVVMLVNALAQPSQRLPGVEPVAPKTNEIPTAQTLIRRLDLKGRLVQLEGMHTQHQTAYREDQSRVRHPNATAVLGLFRRLSNAPNHVWAIGRPRRGATSVDWIERNVSNRRLVIDLITRPVTYPLNSQSEKPSPDPTHSPFAELATGGSFAGRVSDSPGQSGGAAGVGAGVGGATAGGGQR